MFANASAERKAVYFSIIGESPIKMLRYQQQYAFFDTAKIGDGSVRFVHLGAQALEGGLSKVLETIIEVDEAVTERYFEGTPPTDDATYYGGFTQKDVKPTPTL